MVSSSCNFVQAFGLNRRASAMTVSGQFRQDGREDVRKKELHLSLAIGEVQNKQIKQNHYVISDLFLNFAES